MLAIEFTDEERAMLGGWLTREMGHLRCIRVLLRDVVMPRVTGTEEAIKDDFDYINRIKSSIREKEAVTYLDDEDAEQLLAIAQANRYDDRATFWKAIERKIQEKQADG